MEINKTVTPVPERIAGTFGAEFEGPVMIAGDYDKVYASVDQAVRLSGKECRRADNFWVHDAVIQDIVTLICSSSVVICDLSRRNANVFYETGIAHALGKKVILITQSHDDVPFDLGHLRYIHYLDNGEGRLKLVEQIESRIQTLSRIA